MWMYKTRVETVHGDCWLCYISLTLFIHKVGLRKWINSNVNTLKQSGSMLLVHSQLTMGFDQQHLQKEREILIGWGKEIVWTRDGFFCLGVINPHWKGKNLTWLRSALASICNPWFALLQFICGMKLTREKNFLKATRKKEDSDICSTDNFCLLALIKDDKTVENVEGNKDLMCFRTDLLWMSLQYFILCCWLGALPDD